jgi:ABC-type Fe2+-enterobactin transport system substrate-binding protein
MYHPVVRETTMQFRLRTLTPCVLAALLAAPILVSGCKTQNTTINNDQDDYRQWEHDTNRPHQDLERRSADEQREFRDWQRSHHH